MKTLGSTGFVEAILAAHGPVDLSLSPVTVAELVHGIYRAKKASRRTRRKNWQREIGEEQSQR